MNCELLETLIRKYLDGNASTGEIDQLNAWYDSFDPSTDLYARNMPGLDRLVAKKFAGLKSALGLDPEADRTAPTSPTF